MRVRLVQRDKGEYVVMAEMGSGKGKKVTTGKKVRRDGLKAEVARLVKEVRGEE